MLFSDALKAAVDVTKAHAAGLGEEVILVRDLKGRIRSVLAVKPTEVAMNAYGADLSKALGIYGFSPDRALLFKEDMVASEEVFKGKRKLEVVGNLNLYLLDRQITGQDWMRSPLHRTTTNARITFHGIKGGVGRSTALVNWAWHLAEQGKKVLVFDLDLESPGLSSTLLPTENMPDFGIVDWFVEEGIGQGDLILPEMFATSPLAEKSSGKILVVPAYGNKTSDYIPKLSRCYADFSSEGAHSWAERLHRLVVALEEEQCPDVVIFDSRAGLHDIAAVLVTRLDADAFLFAVDSPQTWDGYRLLFEYWAEYPELLRLFRKRLQIIASLVPETGRDDYLSKFREHAWDLFRDHLYDELSADDVDGFSFDIDEERAPHAPLPVFWHRALQEFNPVEGGIDISLAENAFGIFMKRADEFLTLKNIEIAHD
jgi:hypothetical protein